MIVKSMKEDHSSLAVNNDSGCVASILIEHVYNTKPYAQVSNILMVAKPDFSAHMKLLDINASKNRMSLSECQSRGLMKHPLLLIRGVSIYYPNIFKNCRSRNPCSVIRRWNELLHHETLKSAYTRRAIWGCPADFDFNGDYRDAKNRLYSPWKLRLGKSI